MMAEMEGLEANEWDTLCFREREGGFRGRNWVWIFLVEGLVG